MQIEAIHPFLKFELVTKLNLYLPIAFQLFMLLIMLIVPLGSISLHYLLTMLWTIPSLNLSTMPFVALSTIPFVTLYVQLFSPFHLFSSV